MWIYALCILSCLVTIVYTLWQWRTYQWWKESLVKARDFTAIDQSRIEVSILIPARNEASHIGRLLEDLLAQEELNSADEIIVIDDHSTDETVDIVRTFSPRVRLLHLKDYISDQKIVAHKKAALSYAIETSNQPLVVTTDADCRWSPKVLGQIKSAYSQGAEFIAGPVVIAPVYNVLTGFQSLDLIAYMFLTASYSYAGKPILANGANLSFSRKLFEEINGYEGIDHIPSGDDVLLLQKTIDQQPNTKFHFLQSSAAVVTTSPMPDLKRFWAQRLRWAGKTAHYTSGDLRFAQAISFLVAVAILGQLVMGAFSSLLLISGLCCWCLKGCIDYLLLRSSSACFGQEHQMKNYLITQLLQPLYIVLIGSAALMGLKSDWKGR